MRLLVALLSVSAAWAAYPQRAAPRPVRSAEAAGAIEEFRIQTRTLGLRGRDVRQPAQAPASGGRWHGRLYEYFRNDFLDAVPHEVRQRGGRKSVLRRNQFGFSAAGPVAIPGVLRKSAGTYITLTYEGVRESISRANLYTIPTIPERTGDYSSVVDQAGRPLPIYDPSSTRANPNYDPNEKVSAANLQYLRDPFPGNRIPAHRLDAVAQAALSYYPRPNASAGPFFRNNYYVNSTETNSADGVIARLDQSAGSRHRLALNVSLSNGFLGAAKYYATAANPGPVDRDFASRKGSVEHTFTASPQTVNRLAFQADSTISRNGGEADSGAVAIGLRGAAGEFFPIFTVSPYLAMGQPYPKSTDAGHVYTWSEGISTRRGNHNLTATLEYSRRQVNFFGSQYPAGSLRFGSGLTGLPGIVGTGHAFASFLLGLAEHGESSIVPSPSYFRRSSVRFAVKEEWQIRHDFSVTLGFTVNRHSPRTEKYDRQSTVDLAAINPANGRPGALIVAGRNGAGRAFRPATLSPTPSVALAWNPFGDARTVIRSSFARGAGPIEIARSQWGTQAFSAYPTYISPNTQLQPALVLSQGLPAYAHPIPNLAPEAANDTVADLIDSSSRLPVYMDVDFSIERQLPGSVVANARYMFSAGNNLLAGSDSANPNAIPLQYLSYRDRLNDEQFNRSLRPYPQYKGFEVGKSWPLGRNRVSAFTLRVEKRGSSGLTFVASYDLKKVMDDFSGPYGTQDFYNRENEWAIAATNIRHRLQASYSYELPAGPGKLFLSAPGWRQQVLGGWSVIGTATVQSGTPLALRPQFNNTGGVVQSLRVNVVDGVRAGVENPGPALWFNAAAFDQPADFTIGNASRTHPSLRNPGMQNYDLSLSKRIPMSADRAMEFTAAGFDFLNHANWNEPDTVIGPATAPNVNAGRIIGSRGGRVIQLGLRFTF